METYTVNVNGMVVRANKAVIAKAAKLRAKADEAILDQMGIPRKPYNLNKGEA